MEQPIIRDAQSAVVFEQDFGEGWTVRLDGTVGNPRPVTLPHDAMIGETRGADEPSWAHGAYFPGGAYRYRKVWTPPTTAAGSRMLLHFEGVYRHSRVFVNGRDVGGTASGYREFEVELTPHLTPGENLVEVLVDNVDTPNSRWYTGSGIYRPVTLLTRPATHILPDGVAFRTLSFGPVPRAEVRVQVHCDGSDEPDLAVEATLRRRESGGTQGDAGPEVLDRDAADRIAARTRGSVVGGEARLELSVPDALVWSAERPNLYDLEVRLLRGDAILDARIDRVGLRQISVDARRGLRVNGRRTLLRGANLHHDHGVLGAAAFGDAERRRIRILKQNGFNAIRSAHNPAGRALLDACDELGMYVMDELFDGWYDHKTDHDDADLFEATWREEAKAIVRKDRNRASVIAYSIGNENGEALTPRGRRLAAAIAAELRMLDPERLVTIGVNMVAAAFAGLAGGARDDGATTDGATTDGAEADGAEAPAPRAKSAPDMTSTALNVISNRFGVLMKVLPGIRAADRATGALFESFDVAGYNYGTTRYTKDARLHPERVMVGTESMPGDIAKNWVLVESLPALIGDFMWAGWDYLGEAGGGTWVYGRRTAPYLKPFPQLLSGTGAIDITGRPGAPVFLAQAVWGLLDAPAIAVRPVPLTGRPVARTSWRSTDAVPSWSWAGWEGHRAELEVYSADDEVEVVLNGRTLGRKRAGREAGFVSRFRTRYEPGSLVAIGYRGGDEVGRSELRSAGQTTLRLIAETPSGRAAADSLVFVRVELADDHGVVDFATDDVVTLAVSGPAVLAGFGSAAPSTTEGFTDAVHTTYRGSAIAVLRCTGVAGAAHLIATSHAHGAAGVRVDFTP